MFNSSVVTRSRASLPAQLVVAALLFAASTFSSAEIQLTLKNSFIDKYKNRTSISDDCIVDHSKGKPNPASSDGDMHAAVRCPKEIGLPMVAEIMNAKDHGDAIDLTKTAEADGSKVTIKGAWRIWNEHGGDQVFNQGAKVAAAENTNPDHVFEIHPIAVLGDFDLRASFKPIAGTRQKLPRTRLTGMKTRAQRSSQEKRRRRSSARVLATTMSSSRCSSWKSPTRLRTVASLTRKSATGRGI